MHFRRGIITKPSNDRAWVIEDGVPRPGGAPLLVYYQNCMPPLGTKDQLHEGEKVIFKEIFLGPHGKGAGDVRRVAQLSLEESIQFLDVLLRSGDVIHGKTATYRLHRQLGSRGATSIVWEAVNVQNDMHVALKLFAPIPKIMNYGRAANACARFTREASQGQKLRHSNLVQYLDSGEHLGLPFICMELCQGTLADTIKQHGRISLRRTIKIVRQIVEALQHLHARNIVHRDVKPPNVLLRPDGTYCLGDLGIIHLSDCLDDASTSNQLTKTGTDLGSWYYMAPEQRENAAHITEKVDIYALGVSWYEMLTGNKPPSPERISAGDLKHPVLISGPGPLLLQMMSYRPERRPPLSHIISFLENAPPFDASDVEDIVRMGLEEQHYSDVSRATIALTFQVLPRLGLTAKEARQYLSLHGHRKVPLFCDEDGTLSSEFPKDSVDDFAAWVADELSVEPL